MTEHTDWPGLQQVYQYTWIRDTVFGEDASNVRTGVISQVMAAMRNAAISVGRCTGRTKITDALQYLAAKSKRAVNLIK